MTYSIPNNAQDEQLEVFSLFEIAFPGGTVYWTDCDVPILWNGHTWVPTVIETPSIQSRHGEVQGLGSIVIGNADNALSAIVFAAPCGGSILKIHVAWFDPANPSAIPADVITKMVVRVARATLNVDETETNHSCTLELAPFIDFQTKTNWRTEATPCPFRYQDFWCQAPLTATATTCDRTTSATTGCSNPNTVDPPATHGNIKNFGGFAPFVTV